MNIKWGRGQGNGQFVDENQDLKNGVGKNITLKGTLYTPEVDLKKAPSPMRTLSPKHVPLSPLQILAAGTYFL